MNNECVTLMGQGNNNLMTAKYDNYFLVACDASKLLRRPAEAHLREYIHASSQVRINTNGFPFPLA
jgi:hypothetical protein